VTTNPFTQNALIRAGLVGSGIQYSGSPALHMDEAAALGLRLRYELFDFDPRNDCPGALSAVLDETQRQGYAGLNITYPYKQSVLALLDELSVEAEALQAVNTVIFRDGRRHGHNTDWWGFAESFRRGLPDVQMQRAVQLGAGGAGSAVAYAAAKLGIQRLTLVDRDPERARTLAERLADIAPEMATHTATSPEEAMAEADGLIHATPIGMAKSPGIALSVHCLRSQMWVAEVVYVPLITELLAAARDRHCRTLDGGGMAVYQAAAAFRLFTGIEPDSERMRRNFLSKYGSVKTVPPNQAD